MLDALSIQYIAYHDDLGLTINCWRGKNQCYIKKNKIRHEKNYD